MSSETSPPESASTSSKAPWFEDPALLRYGAFVAFVALTALQGKLGPGSEYWVYALKTLLGAGALIFWMRGRVSEMKWSFSLEAVVVGILVCVLWVVLEPFTPTLFGSGESEGDPAPAWNPLHAFADQPALAWGMVAVRILGSSLVVAPLEEVFFRSFLYRWISNPDFEKEPLGKFGWLPFLVTSAIFAAEHHEWLAGLLCGFLYQGLVLRKKRLGDAILAHAITNALLGIWVVTQGAWKFW